MGYKVWVWVGDGDPQLAPTADRPGAAWEPAGEIDASEAPELAKAAQRRLTNGGGRASRASGYLRCDPIHPWVSEHAASAESFHIALGPIGITNVYLVSRKPVVRTNLTKRAPESPPGLLRTQVYLPVRLDVKGGAHFDRYDAQDAG